MKIYCVGCDKHMGEIRDATLRKPIFYLCEDCNTKRIASDMKKGTNFDYGEGNFFNDLMGKLGGK